MSRGSGPIYWRILRLRRVRPGPATTFVLFEGSVIAGLLLVLAEVLSWWGAAVIPVAVALMVKLNDVVATAVDLRPVAGGQPRRASTGSAPSGRVGDADGPVDAARSGVHGIDRLRRGDRHRFGT